MTHKLILSDGNAQTLGVLIINDSTINVAVLAPNAQAVDFCIFDGEHEIACLRLPAQMSGIHHGQIEGVSFPLYYGLRAKGEYWPEAGLFYDYNKLLIDPYAKQLSRALTYDDTLQCQNFGVDTAHIVPKTIVAGNAPLPDLKVVAHQPMVIYEASVKALTMLHPDVPEHLRGTVAALREPCVIEHLLKIGVDTLELMPITAWINEPHLHHFNLHNAWGYNPIAMMVPDPNLCPGGVQELRDTVLALNAVGIQVILDVVFNHTGESDVGGLTISMRGLDNHYYYAHDANNQLVNVTGCGNTLNCSQAGVGNLVMDSLRYWVQTAGVAGFRFDLAPVLGRLADGFDANAPLLKMMREDEVLSKVLLIAEPWDIGLGGYQLGQFGVPWLEWNDKYRDDVRRFWQGLGTVSSLATRLAGSSDVFAHDQRSPRVSVNFVAAHDGFCLSDLVSYHQKYNWDNGEQNRDGSNHNVSWNNGAEGVTDDVVIIQKRQRDVRALLTTLFVSQGTVMFTAGDELGKTQNGNNNAYAQDNAVTWIDWHNRNEDLIEFVGCLARFRREHSLLYQQDFLNTQKIIWYRLDGQVMNEHDWHNNAQTLGMRLHGTDDLLIWFNSSDVDAIIWLPDDMTWQKVLCSVDSASDDLIGARSVVVLQSQSLL